MKILYNILFIGLPLIAVSQKNAHEVNFEKKKYSLPIKPTRTISFTTNEGSYMDVDISPDGKTILFDLLGDLYTIPASGGTAKQLTFGLAINYFPSWSPDGKFIAYSSDASGDRRLHVRNIEGTFEKMFDLQAQPSVTIQSGRPKWLPDGQHIAFGEFLYHWDGGKKKLNEVMNVKGKLTCFSNEGRFFYTEQRHNNMSFFRRYDIDTRKDTVIFSLKDDSFNGKVSPNGRWLVYMKLNFKSDTLKLMGFDSTNGQNRVLALINTKSLDYLGNHIYSFSSDSRFIYIGYQGKIHRIDLESGKDETIPFTANVQVGMGPLNYNTFPVSNDSFEVQYTRSANASPTGDQLVFSALNRVYIQDIPKGKPRILSSQPFGQFYPVFSPNGQWLAYVSWSDTAGGHIWRIPFAGGTPEQLTHTAGRYQYLNWSPDGQQIVTVKGELGNIPSVDEPEQGQIVIINVSNGKERIIAEGVPFYNSPAFSADGSRVIYMNREADQKLVEKKIDNGTITVLARIRKSDLAVSTGFRQMIISPDKKYIVYTENEDLFLVPITLPGQPVLINYKDQNLPVIRFAEGAFDPHWEQGGKILSWSYANKYYQVTLDNILKIPNNQIGKNTRGYNFIKTKVIPDRTITMTLLAPRNFGKGTIMLTNTRIITMKGNRVIEKGTIVIKDGRFIAVDESNKIALTKDATIFDLSGKTILPGLIDLHAHYQNWRREIFPQQNWKFLVNLAYGVTTARDPSAGHDEFGYSELLQEGSMLGPRLYSSGQAVRPHYQITDLNEAQSVVNNHLIDNGTFIKQYKLNTRLQRQWLLMASKKSGMNMTNEGDENPLEYLGKIKDGSTGVEHSPIWGNVSKDMIRLIAASGTFLTPTLQISHYFTALLYFRNQYYKKLDSQLVRFTPESIIRSIMQEAREADTIPTFINDAKIAAEILHTGGKIVMGSHGEDQGIGAHFEIWALHMGGFTNMEALQCATLTAAEGLGMQNDLGSIEVGKIADLIILDKNPLEDIRNTKTIRYIVKDGVLYDADSLNTVWPVKTMVPSRK